MISRKPHGPGLWQDTPNTFLSRNTSGEDLEEQLEEKNFEHEPRDLGESSQKKIHKIDSGGRLVHKKVNLKLETSWKKRKLRMKRRDLLKEDEPADHKVA